LRKLLVLSTLALLFVAPLAAAPYLGDYVEDETVHFIWSTNDSSGASVTRTVDGTVSVYKDNGATQSTAGVSGTEDFDGLTGIHECTIDLSADAFYAVGADYTVVLSAATIDSQTVNAVLAHFSIENRFAEVDVTKWNGTAVATPDTAGYAKVTVKSGTGTGEINLTSGVADANVEQIDTVAASATNLMRSTSSIVVGQAQTGTLSSTQMTTNLTEATDNHYIGRLLCWVSGVLSGSCTYVTDYDGASKMLTYSETQTAEAPSNNDYFVLM